jgi:hypothetical protein
MAVKAMQTEGHGSGGEISSDLKAGDSKTIGENQINRTRKH